MNFSSEYRSWKSMLWQFLPNYNLSWKDNAFFTTFCCANGFLLVNNTGYQDSLFNAYDINSAYPYMLATQKFPLDKEIEIIKDKDTYEDVIANDLGLVEIRLTGVPLPKYENFDYSIFDGYIFEPDESDGTKRLLHLTTVDARIFLDMYKVENMEIHLVAVFKNMGYIKGLNHNVRTLYESVRNIKEKNKEEGKEYKRILNMITYGSFIELDVEKSEEHETLIRDNNCLLGIWVASYQRYRMYQLFKKYQDDILYMDTDSIMLKASRKFEEETSSTELGKFKVEASNVNIAVIRPKAYVFIKDGKVIKQKIGGLERNLTTEELKHLFNFGSVEVNVTTMKLSKETQMYERYTQSITVTLYYPNNFGSLSLD